MAVAFAIHPSPTPLDPTHRQKILEAPGFGVHFSDHMAKATWTSGEGWHAGRICAVEPYSLHPAAAVLHYGQEIFEGLKAYRHSDGSIALFRPEKNAQRFQESAGRLVLPVLDSESFVDSIDALVRCESDWVPSAGTEASLYLRPYMFASEAFLGVRPAAQVEYAVLASPAGPYFTRSVSGITLWISTRYSRAAPGGTGAAKCGGNYASSLIAQMEAIEHDCDQVLFTGGPPENPVVEESGTMNVFVVMADGRLLTPPLGVILDGVTRDCVIALADQHGLRAYEQEITLSSLIEGCRDGSVREVFAAGTAAIITPIVRLRADDVDVVVGGGEPGPKAQSIRNHLLGIQIGEEPDTFSWLHLIKPD